MSSPNFAVAPNARRRLFISTLTGVAVAALLLIAVVLPAEYGKDLTGVGTALGLTPMGAAKQAGAATNQLMHAHERKYRTANLTITLGPRAEMEYKATLEQGEPLLYAWVVNGGEVYFEFHGEPTQGEWPEGFYRSYEIKERANTASGSFVAPFTGQHGWYWRNLGDDAVTITLDAAGYYSRLGRIEGGGAAVE